MLDIIFVVKDYSKEKNVIEEIRQSGCNVIVYNINLNEELQVAYSNLVMVLRKKTYHIMCSVDFDEILANAGYASGTKYVSIQQNMDENALNSEYINYPTNYVLINELLAYIQFRKEGIETVYYSMNLGEIWSQIILNEELTIYETILELEDFRKRNGQVVVSKDKKLEEMYDGFAKEKDFLFRLKKQFMLYVDCLLKKKSNSSWEELIVWYNRNGTRDLRQFFWEFYVLDIMIKVFKEEREVANRLGANISILQFSSMQELFNVYFKAIFMLRRLEYDVAEESCMETVVFIKQNSLSDIFMKYIFENGQIEDRRKVAIKLKQLWQEYDNE